MRAEWQESITIDAPVETVYRYLADFPRHGVVFGAIFTRVCRIDFFPRQMLLEEGHKTPLVFVAGLNHGLVVLGAFHQPRLAAPGDHRLRCGVTECENARNLRGRRGAQHRARRPKAAPVAAARRFGRALAFEHARLTQKRFQLL